MRPAMIFTRAYFSQAWMVRHGKVILAIQGVVFVVGVLLFFRFAPWLMASDISQIGTYEAPKPPPPDWAKSFFVSHGKFYYFQDSRSTAPGKAIGIVALLVAGGAVEWACTRAIKRGAGG